MLPQNFFIDYKPLQDDINVRILNFHLIDELSEALNLFTDPTLQGPNLIEYQQCHKEISEFGKHTRQAYRILSKSFQKMNQIPDEPITFLQIVFSQALMIENKSVAAAAINYLSFYISKYQEMDRKFLEQLNWDLLIKYASQSLDQDTCLLFYSLFSFSPLSLQFCYQNGLFSAMTDLYDFSQDDIISSKNKLYLISEILYLIDKFKAITSMKDVVLSLFLYVTDIIDTFDPHLMSDAIYVINSSLILTSSSFISNVLFDKPVFDIIFSLFTIPTNECTSSEISSRICTLIFLITSTHQPCIINHLKTRNINKHISDYFAALSKNHITDLKTFDEGSAILLLESAKILIENDPALCTEMVIIGFANGLITFLSSSTFNFKHTIFNFLGRLIDGINSQPVFDFFIQSDFIESYVDFVSESEHDISLMLETLLIIQHISIQKGWKGPGPNPYIVQIQKEATHNNLTNLMDCDINDDDVIKINEILSYVNCSQVH